MKKLYKLGAFVTTGVIFLSSLASRAYAVSLCPTLNASNGSTLCGADLSTALPGIVNILLFVAFIAALIFLVYGGIRWILSGGDKEGTAKAKGTVTAALIGLAIVLASWLLVNIVLGLFGLTNKTGSLDIPTIFGLVK